MKTIKVKTDESNILKTDLDKAVEILSGGGLVAFPTETVYGLGGNALSNEASRKIYAAKGRPSDNPLIVHIADCDELEALVAEIPNMARPLIEKYWPGPMTLIFKKSDIVPKETTGGLNTVAIRMPSHPIARKLIRACKFPIAAPSANSSGRPSPTRAEHVVVDLDGKIDMIIDGGSCDIGLESTIIDVTGKVPEILRPGFISPEEVADICGRAVTDKGMFEKPQEDFLPKAPGMKYRHYAPSAEMTVVTGDEKNVIEKLSKLLMAEDCNEKKIGIICGEDTAAALRNIGPKEKLILTYGDRDDGNLLAKNFYDFLRRMDEENVDEIFAEGYQGSVMKGAITNRMLKAAGYNVMEV